MNIADLSVFKPPKKKSSFNVDREIWLNFLNGDRKSFEFLYNDNVDHLYNYGMKIEPDCALVEDCIHELFIDLWNNRNNLSQIIEVKFYLLKALRYKIYRSINSNINRKRILEYKYYPDQLKVDLPYEELLINEQISSEKKIKLHKAINKLSSRQREVLTLLFFEKYPYEKVALIMSMNIKSVYTLAWKALSSLKKTDLYLVIVLVNLFL